SYSSYSSLLFSSIRPPPISTLFPYTTLFRSRTVLILRFLLISPARSPGVCSCLLRRPVQPRRRRRATGLQGSGGHGLSVFPVTLDMLRGDAPRTLGASGQTPITWVIVITAIHSCSVERVSTLRTLGS